MPVLQGARMKRLKDRRGEKRRKRGRERESKFLLSHQNSKRLSHGSGARLNPSQVFQTTVSAAAWHDGGGAEQAARLLLQEVHLWAVRASRTESTQGRAGPGRGPPRCTGGQERGHRGCSGLAEERTGRTQPASCSFTASTLSPSFILNRWCEVSR